MNEDQQSTVEQLQELFRSHEYAPDQIAEATLHALYPKISAGAAGTWRQLGRGAVLLDLRDLENGHLDTMYVPVDKLHRLNKESSIFGDAETAVLDYDPEHEFVVVIWQTTLLMIYRLEQI